MSPEKIQKKGDSFREAIVIESSKKFSLFFNQCLEEI
jgi:hypothetical protein